MIEPHEIGATTRIVIKAMRNRELSMYDGVVEQSHKKDRANGRHAMNVNNTRDMIAVYKLSIGREHHNKSKNEGGLISQAVVKSVSKSRPPSRDVQIHFRADP